MSSVILDDVLAAVDSHVARHVFGASECQCAVPVSDWLFQDHVIGPYGLLASKGRILVTNSISFLKHFDKIVYLRRGLMIESGTYEELTTNSETQLYKLM